MDKIIKHNADTIKYLSPKQYGDFKTIEHAHLTTNDVYSVDGVIKLFKDIISTVLREEYDEDDSRHFYIKRVGIEYTKYGLDLSENIGIFMSNSSTLVVHSDKESSEEQVNEWVDSHLKSLKAYLPSDSNVIQSFNKLDNYLRIVDEQFPPIPNFEKKIEPKLEPTEPAQGVDWEVYSVHPPKVVYDITYVCTGVECPSSDLKDHLLNFIFGDVPFNHKQLGNRMKFFYSNFEVQARVFFEVGGQSITLSTSGRLIRNG